MSVDHDLIEVITDLGGAVWPLADLVELRGTTFVPRVPADGFAAVFQAESAAIAEVRSLHGLG